MIKSKKVFIIAEAGVNHNGSLSVAKRLAYNAAKAGADAVKFQTFKAKNEITKYAPLAEYQKKIFRKLSQYEMVKKLELSHKDHKKLKNYCKKINIEFMSSAFDIPSLKFLKSINIKKFKIPSGEITNFPYLKEIGSYNAKIILSTGMCNLTEIDRALKILKKSGTKNKNISILHCHTDYPTSMSDVNLSTILTLKKRYNNIIGYSDHTLGIEMPIAAAALGSNIIEKHITLNKKMSGPDHSSSIEPQELKKMIHSIRNVEKAFGNGIKKPTRREKKNIPIVRKSIVAMRKIKIGETFNEENITTKRPGYGISPMKWVSIIGKKSKKNYEEDDLI